MPLVTSKFVFYHVPRTGGLWIRAVLDNLGIEYRYQGYAHDIPAKVPTRKFSFTIRRYEPNWLVSWRKLVETNPKWSWPVPSWMLNAISVEDAQNVFARYACCNAILNTEDLQRGLQLVFDEVGLDMTVPDLPPVNEG